MYVWWYAHWFSSLIISISENDIDGGHHINTTMKTCSIQWQRQCIFYFVGTMYIQCKALHVWKIHPVRHYQCLVSIVIEVHFYETDFLLTLIKKIAISVHWLGHQFILVDRIRRRVLDSRGCIVFKLLIDNLPSFCNWNKPHLSIHSYNVKCIKGMTASVESIYMWIYEQEW